jgi:uncharacterized alkaline shock family protein YloU
VEEQPNIGRITIAPEVLETIARLTTLAVPGVARLVPPPGVRRLLRHPCVDVAVDEDKAVSVVVYLMTESGVNMLNVGRQVQAEVTRAIQDLVGMRVKSVDVHIEDVVGTPAEE